MSEKQSDGVREKQFKKCMKMIRRNPENGLRRFYDTYSKILYSAASLICGSQDKKNEVVNEVLKKIWRQAFIKEEIKKPEGWLYIVTLNTAKDLMKYRYEFSLDETILASNSEVEEIHDRDSFYWLIAGLSDTEQKVMILRYVADYIFQEIADEMQKPLSTITSIHYRGLQKIKKKLEEKKK